jgi:hypothetical protein
MQGVEKCVCVGGGVQGGVAEWTNPQISTCPTDGGKLSVSRSIHFYLRLNVLCGSGYTMYSVSYVRENRSVRNNIGNSVHKNHFIDCNNDDDDNNINNLLFL